MRPDAPRRWILIAREQGIAESSDAAARWAVDHLLVDQDAVPTLVEVKRGSSPEIRRTIVGQVLEYAAHAARTWRADTLRQAFEESTHARGLDPSEELGKLLVPDGEGEPDADGFWERVATNLAAARLRLLFVADDIPDPLERVVEFLNAQMDRIEVLAVEVKQFKGDSRQTLVPRVIGRTAAPPRPPSGHGSRAKLDQESFLSRFTEFGTPSRRRAAPRRRERVRRRPGLGLQRRLHPDTLLGLEEAGRRRVALSAVGKGRGELAWIDRRVVRKHGAPLRRWMEEIGGYDFANDVTVRHAYPAQTIAYDDAALHIDRLASGLARVVSEIRSL